jgi:hypothetical protein
MKPPRSSKAGTWFSTSANPTTYARMRRHPSTYVRVSRSPNCRNFALPLLRMVRAGRGRTRRLIGDRGVGYEPRIRGQRAKTAPRLAAVFQPKPCPTLWDPESRADCSSVESDFVDFQSADAANTLDPGKLQFPATQRLRISLAIRNVAKRDPDAIVKRKSPHFVIAIGAQRRIALEFLPRALLHDTPTTSVEFRPQNLGRGVPKQSANNFGARHAEDCLRRAIAGSDTPVTIKREETLAHPLEERFNERLLV